MKATYINAYTPGGARRSLDVVTQRIIQGKLADYAVKELVEGGMEERGIGSLSVVEYDNVRTDDYRRPDEYDLRLRDASNGSMRDIEVRSSFCYRLFRPERMVNRLSIYGWYVSGNKSIEPQRDYYWQVIYYARPRNIGRQDSWPDVEVFEDAVMARRVVAYVVGGATKSQLEDSAISQDRFDDQEGARYRSITPICKGMDVRGILTATLQS